MPQVDRSPLAARSSGGQRPVNTFFAKAVTSAVRPSASHAHDRSRPYRTSASASSGCAVARTFRRADSIEVASDQRSDLLEEDPAERYARPGGNEAKSLRRWAVLPFLGAPAAGSARPQHRHRLQQRAICRPSPEFETAIGEGYDMAQSAQHNCFVGGQCTNCNLNASILDVAKQRLDPQIWIVYRWFRAECRGGISRRLNSARSSYGANLKFLVC